MPSPNNYIPTFLHHASVPKNNFIVISKINIQRVSTMTASAENCFLSHACDTPPVKHVLFSRSPSFPLEAPHSAHVSALNYHVSLLLLLLLLPSSSSQLPSYFELSLYPSPSTPFPKQSISFVILGPCGKTSIKYPSGSFTKANPFIPPPFGDLWNSTLK